MKCLVVLICIITWLAIVPSSASAQKPVDLLEKKTFSDAKGKTLSYRLLKPDNYDPKQSYPLVVFLHGAGERGTDNTAQLVHGVAEFAKDESRKNYPCFLIAPQCPIGARWCEVDWGAAAHVMPKEPSEPARLTLELIAAMQKEYRIDPKRLYITGLSMGGFGVWDLIARRPDLFAAAVPVCGGGDEATAPAIAKLPVWAFHGDKDAAVKVSRSRNMIEAMKNAGGTPKYTEYAGVGHNSWEMAYRDADMMKWLLSQTRP